MRTQPPQLVGTSVLLVEDERDVRDMLAEGLKWHGARVYAADCAETAWRLFGEAKPRIIVADLGLPGVDGFQFLKEIRSLPKSAGGATPERLSFGGGTLLPDVHTKDTTDTTGTKF